MEQQASLREVNQHLSHYIDIVENGHEVLITRRGQPVAKLVPAQVTRKLTKKQQAAWERIAKFIDPGFNLGKEKFKREDLYDRY